MRLLAASNQRELQTVTVPLPGAPSLSTQPTETPLVDRVLDALQTRELFTRSFCTRKKISPLFEKDVQALSAEEVHHVLTAFIEQEHAGTRQTSIDEILEAFSHIVPLEKLQEAIRTEYPDHIDALTTAKSMLQEALYFLDKTEKRTPALKEYFKTALQMLISALENIISVFGIAGFFKPHTTDVEAEGKFQRILALIYLFSSLSPALIPIFGVTIGASVVGACLVLIAVLSLVYCYIKPCPTQLNKAQNWTKMYREHTLEEVSGRKETLDELAHTLISSSGAKTHPMLVGPSGVGKTEMIKAFVRAIEQGEYPELKGKQVFYIDTGAIVDSRDFISGENKVLTTINEAMGRHREQCILVFDEIQKACGKNKEGSDLSDQLKLLLDEGYEKFPHVIGITTDEEFVHDIASKNKPFARRFKTIPVTTMSIEETEETLSNFLLKYARDCLVAPGILRKLIERTKTRIGRTEPAASMQILSQCIQRTTASQKSPIQKQIDTIRSKILAIHAGQASLTGHSLLPYSRTSSEESQLEEELHELEVKRTEEKEKVRHVFQLKKELEHAKTEMLRTVVTISKLQKKHLSPKDERLLSHFLITSHLRIPSLEKTILRESKELGMQVEITEEIIDRVIQAELEKTEKSKAALSEQKATQRECHAK